MFLNSHKRVFKKDTERQTMIQTIQVSIFNKQSHPTSKKERVKYAKEPQKLAMHVMHNIVGLRIHNGNSFFNTNSLKGYPILPPMSSVTSRIPRQNRDILIESSRTFTMFQAQYQSDRQVL